MQIEEDVNIARHTTFRMGGFARYFARAKSVADLKKAYHFAQKKGLAVIVLGGGSNTIFPSGGTLRGLVLKIEVKGFKIISENKTSANIEVGAGENWDGIVARTVKLGLSGLEALSAIPGTAGATPIQNVGAYGAETKDVLVSLEAFDIKTGKMRTFKNKDCKFGYRDSIFKREAKGKYIITSLVLKLSRRNPAAPDYPGVKKYFIEKGIAKPTLGQIREAIIAIRASKLPDPRDIASVGSFFKNPFVTSVHHKKLEKNFPNIVAFPVSKTKVKIGAGWLIDTLGLKGKKFGRLLLYPNNALVIVNTGGATQEELLKLVRFIQEQVKNTFGIEIEPEPIIIQKAKAKS